MKSKIFTIITAAFLTVASGCSDEPMTNDSDKGDANLPLTLQADYPTLTRASDAGFEDGDQMGVFVLDYKEDAPESIDGYPHASNVRFIFNGGNNTWAGSTQLYWSDTKTPADIIGYYPFRTEISSTRAMSVEVERHQDTEGTDGQPGGYEASDLLYAKSSKVMPTSERVNLTFMHALAGLKVTLLAGQGFGDDEWAALDKGVLFPDMESTGSIDLATGAVTTSPDARVSIIPVDYNGDFRAVTMPQDVAAGTPAVSVTVDGKSYNLVKDSAMRLEAGKLHTFTITVNKKADGGLQLVLTGESVTPWLDDVEFRDGLMRQYTVVNVAEKGTLANVIAEMELQPDRIYNLKITGEINEEDFRYLRFEVPYLKAINLYDAKVYDQGRADRIPAEAFFQKDVLSHCIFPRHLKEIGTAAFAFTGLMGDLVIPEGVEKIGDNEDLNATPYHWGDYGVFAICKKLTGTLSLPSTLRFIEKGAFEWSGLTGALSIPENVTFIGSRAFESVAFTGELTLPSRIATIGTAAFAGCKFTGSLTVPQGMKQLRAWTFSGGFTGTLSIPEGVEVIDGLCFSGCGFVGEVKFPSTLRQMGDRVFMGSSISSVIFNDGLLSIGASAFQGCSRLSGTLMLPPKIALIEEYTFADCSLLDGVVIQKEVARIKGGAFQNCYNISSIVCNAEVPPILQNEYIEDDYNRPRGVFDGVPKDNFTVQVPGKSVDTYRSDSKWGEFRRISAYSSFVCRPQKACALNTSHSETLTLNAEGAWTVTHLPSWVTVSRMSGNGKTELMLTFSALPQGEGTRSDYVEFTMTGKEEAVTRCDVVQCDYVYGEDQCVTLQQATKGRGIDILFVGDGFDAESIASGEYLVKVRRQYKDFFAIEPYAAYKDYFNVYVCFPLSQDKGVNTANRWFNTRFRTYYESASGCSQGGLACYEPDNVFDYAVAHSPLTGQDMWRSLVIMTLNSDEYGSVSVISQSGAAIAIVGDSRDPYPMDSRGLLQREACGAAFGKLADERTRRVQYLTKAEREQLRLSNERGWSMNLSLDGNVRTVWWNWLAFDSRYSVNVDVFEGGLDRTRGCFRAEINSCMNFGIPYFSAAARYDIARRIMDYAGEPFSKEIFLEYDSDAWGETNGTRAVGDFRNAVVSVNNPVRCYKSRKY